MLENGFFTKNSVIFRYVWLNLLKHIGTPKSSKDPFVIFVHQKSSDILECSLNRRSKLMATCGRNACRDVEKGRFSNTAQSRNSSTDFLHFQRRSLQILPLLSQIGPHVFGGVKQVRPAQGRLCEKWRYCRERQKLEPPRIIDMSLEKEVKISLEESIVSMLEYPECRNGSLLIYTGI